MKRILLPIAATLALAVLPGCQKELDKIVPSGSVMSPEQVQKGATISPERAGASVAGLFSMYNEYDFLGAGRQSDFGYPSLSQYLEEAGDNVVSTTHGYNWFVGGLTHTGFQTKNAQPTVYAWNAFYKNIKLANDIIASMKAGEGDELIDPVLGQAYSMRAWDYFHLIRLFAKTYKGNESALGVPIITDETDPAIIANNPRATVQEVYDLILADIDKAVSLLNPDGKPYDPGVKNQISGAVAYGIRARINLTMHRFAEAAADAQKAIDNFAGAPFSLKEVSIPNFDDVATGANSMWGIIITNDDDVTTTGIANWTSMFTSLCFGYGGYTTMVGTYKMLNSRVWKQIPETDIRREWWVYPHADGSMGSELLTNAYGEDAQFFLYDIADAWGFAPLGAYPYVGVKFAPNQKDIMSEVNAVDFQLMRVEEMYYILAEAQAKAGNLSAGVATLTNFVKKYRDPGFNKSFSSADALADEIYFQKRIEFWGEGVVWYDMLRLHKGINRVDPAKKDNGGYPATTRYNIPDGDPMFTWQIPEAEEQANAGIGTNNNPAAVPPKDIM